MNTVQSNGVINNQNGGSVTISGTFENYAGGTLINAGEVEFSGVTVNSGAINNMAGATLSFRNGGPVSLDGSVTNNGTISAVGGVLNFAGGVSGSGIFNAAATSFGGSVNSGNSPGLMTMLGDAGFLAGSTLTMEINGADRGDLTTTDGIGYDAFDISGNLLIDAGAFLEIDLLDAFLPTSGDIFDLAYVSGVITGDFGLLTSGWSVFVETGTFGDGSFSSALRVQFVGTEVSEPASLAVLSLGLIALYRSYRRKRA